MSSTITRARILLAALLFAALVVLPALDAMACAFETVPMQGTHADAGAAGEPDHATGLCSHSHCHHGGGVLLAAPTLEPSANAAGRPAAYGRVLALSDAAHGLMRPPRN